MSSVPAISPELKRACDLSHEIIRTRASLRNLQKRLGTPFEGPGDVEKAREMAHTLRSLMQESQLVMYIYQSESGVPAAANAGK